MSLESWLSGETSTAPERRTFVVDVATGVARPKERLPRHAGSVRFPIGEMHEFLMMFVNVNTWRELVCFFRKADYVPSSGSSWPSRRIGKVAEVWKMYRDLTRDMLLGKQLVAYPPEMQKRALRMPPEKKELGELYDPLDLMWIAHIKALIYDDARAELLGRPRRTQRYAICATPECGRFVPASWPPKQGPTPRYCDRCNGKVRDLAGHHKRKRDYDDECRKFLKKALGSLPGKERELRNHPQLMALARRLHQKIRKQLQNVPGVRGDRWIAKQLRRKEFNGQ